MRPFPTRESTFINAYQIQQEIPKDYYPANHGAGQRLDGVCTSHEFVKSRGMNPLARDHFANRSA
ncbi:MAG: hypothetical protein WCR20_09415 [Verrucomicrobiota bacterium]|nr:hypothetical protein [Verrucomicrobiota bacterium]